MFCASKGKSSRNELHEAFQRSSVGGHVQIAGYDRFVSNGHLLYPPNKITDLKVFQTEDDDGKTFAMKWTAVGAYLDKGNGRKLYIYTWIKVTVR